MAPDDSEIALARMLYAWRRWRGTHPQNNAHAEGTLLRLADRFEEGGWVKIDPETDTPSLSDDAKALIDRVQKAGRL